MPTTVYQGRHRCYKDACGAQQVYRTRTRSFETKQDITTKDSIQKARPRHSSRSQRVAPVAGEPRTRNHLEVHALECASSNHLLGF